MDRRNLMQNLIPFLNGTDENSLLKIQDIMDIIYKMNRIRDDSYDNNYLKRLNNMSNAEKFQNIMRSFSQNADKTTKQNTESMINIFENIEFVKNNMNQSTRNQNLSSQKHSNANAYTGYSKDDALEKIEKIKDFLKSLNG